MALAYVAGFAILIVPSGLGVREYFLTLLLLNPQEDRSRASVLLTVLILRVVWTVAELLFVAAVWWVPGEKEKPGPTLGAPNLAEGNPP
jgi:uncharacterized membrane protein YbhN (UPF0104 family)